MTSSQFNRRSALKAGAALGAATTLNLTQFAQAWAQASPFKPEKGAKLQLLRWKRFIQAEEDAFMKLVAAYSQATGVEVRVVHESLDDVQPKASVSANTGQGPDLFWGLIASMLVGNAMLVVINLPLIGLWVRLLKVPYRLFFPAILVFCCIGVYSLNNSIFEVGLLMLFGVVGYALLKWKCEPAPLMLAFVLGPLMEENLRRAMILSRGDPMTFVERPISAALIFMAGALLLLVLLPAFKRTRQTAF